MHEEGRHVDEGSSQRWAGDRGERPLPRLLLVLLPIGSYREVSIDLASRAGTAPKGLAIIRGHLGCYPNSCRIEVAALSCDAGWAPLHTIGRRIK